MAKCPVSVTVLSIIGLICSSLAMLSFIYLLAIHLMGISSSPAVDALYRDPVFLTITIAGYGIAVPLNGLLFAASIGSLKLRLWAWRGMMVFAWVYIIQSVIGLVLNVIFIMPRTHAAIMASARPMPPGAPSMDLFFRIGEVLGVCMGLGFLAYPICILIFYRRPRVRDAFHGIFPATGTDFPVEIHGRPNPLPPPGQFP